LHFATCILPSSNAIEESKKQKLRLPRGLLGENIILFSTPDSHD